MKPLIHTGSQTVGPFFHLGLHHPAWSDLTAQDPAGDKIHIEGYVFDGDGAPVPDAMLEIWQANAAGKYRHPDDTQDKAIDPKFIGFGRTCTNKEGFYRFTTVRPGSVPGHGNALQAPHVSMSLFGRGILRRMATRIYFDDHGPLNETDPVLSSIEDPVARKTLIAASTRPAGGQPVAAYRFDVFLQGDRETVFFEI